MNQNFDKLKQLLQELFQLDRADLDFGIYRIINKQREKVTQFLDEDLLPQVKAAFNKYQSSNHQVLKQELEKTIENAKSAGFNPDDSPKVKELKEKIANIIDVTALEEEVYSHLYNFFRRYYSEGDFLSLRRYKEGVYAIPYEGEEVKLHWANADQYYIKSSENLRNYAFKLPSGNRVKFEVVAATLEKDNNKAANGKERKFYLCEHEPFIIEGHDLVIRFQYQANSENQESLNTATCERIFNLKGLEKWQVELRQKQPTDKNSERTLLEKYITDFTAKNTFDYFIHKDLGGFLRRELDFYIKTEVMHLDDIENETALRVGRYLDQIKALRQVAHKIITFVEQIENFQKKLWLKKKFVVETNYCITLDRVPEELYSEIIANTAQIEEWKRLFAIDEIQGDLVTPGYSEPLTVDFLKANQFLVVDTALFSEQFKVYLISGINGLDAQCEGILVHSDNFHALGLLQEKYHNKIQSVYIDPPYNTDASEIIYKNGYRHSSWLSLMEDRLALGKTLLTNEGIECVTIDDVEFHLLREVIEREFGKDNILGVVIIKNNPSGRSTARGFSIAHEYGIFIGKTDLASIGRIKRNERQNSRYNQEDENGSFEWVNFRKHGGTRDESPKMFYPIFVSRSNLRIPEIVWNQSNLTWQILENPKEDEIIVYPVDENGKERRWKWGIERVRNEFNELSVKVDRLGNLAVYVKSRINEEGMLPLTLWDKAEYSSTAYGTNLIKNIFGQLKTFSYPKSINAVEDSLRVCNLNDGEIVLDFFAGSGTTGHAVINLNREDGGNRKYILVEMGEYFNTVLKPRIQKVIYSKDWKDGKPVSREGISHCFKYIRLESYEDALNNIEIYKLDQPTQLTLDQYQNFRESYMLSYMLEMETKGSASLLNVEAFNKPFDYKIKIWQNEEFREIPVDLVETFNYLLGLNVQRIQILDNVKIVEGINRGNQNVLIIWRDLDEIDNDILEQWFINHFTEHEFDLIYVNYNNNLANIRPVNATWQVFLTEAEFKRLMFDIQYI